MFGFICEKSLIRLHWYWYVFDWLKFHYDQKTEKSVYNWRNCDSKAQSRSTKCHKYYWEPSGWRTTFSNLFFFIKKDYIIDYLKQQKLKLTPKEKKGLFESIDWSVITQLSVMISCASVSWVNGSACIVYLNNGFIIGPGSICTTWSISYLFHLWWNIIRIFYRAEIQLKSWNNYKNLEMQTENVFCGVRTRHMNTT